MRNKRSALPARFPTTGCAQRVAELRAAGADTAAAEAAELVGAVERAEQAPAVSGTDGAWYALQALRMLEGNPSGAAVDLAAHYRMLLDTWTDVESQMHRIYDQPD